MLEWVPEMGIAIFWMTGIYTGSVVHETDTARAMQLMK